MLSGCKVFPFWRPKHVFIKGHARQTNSKKKQRHKIVCPNIISILIEKFFERQFGTHTRSEQNARNAYVRPLKCIVIYVSCVASCGPKAYMYIKTHTQYLWLANAECFAVVDGRHCVSVCVCVVMLPSDAWSGHTHSETQMQRVWMDEPRWHERTPFCRRMRVQTLRAFVHAFVRVRICLCVNERLMRASLYLRRESAEASSKCDWERSR